MRILHLASFVGNIGDNASHQGLRRLLGEQLPDARIEPLEIRRFYQSQHFPQRLHFDKAFVEQANAYDLLIVGGGGFLDYWHSNSHTATTLDFAPGVLDALSVPLLISSVGAMPLHSVAPENLRRARVFFDQLQARDNTWVALRNDGSIDAVRRDLGPEYATGFSEILDNGFFYSNQAPNTLPQKHYVAINITDDQLAMRRADDTRIDPLRYHAQWKQVLEYLALECGLNIVLVPHIYRDLQAISALLNSLDDWFVRQHVTVAPCLQGDAGADQLFAIYRHSQLVLGMRLHANVCSLVMGCRVLGLAALDRVRYLHESLGRAQHTVSVTDDFAVALCERIDQALAQPPMSEAQQHKLRQWQDHSRRCYADALAALL